MRPAATVIPLHRTTPVSPRRAITAIPPNGLCPMARSGRPTSSSRTCEAIAEGLTKSAKRACSPPINPQTRRKAISTAALHVLHGGVESQRLAYLGLAGTRLDVEEGFRRHHHAGDAVATLGCLRVDEGLLQRMRGFDAAEPFERDDLAALGQPDRQGAGARRLAVYQHRASTAFAEAAAEFRAVQRKVVAQEEEQGGLRLALDEVIGAVDAQGEAPRRSHGSPKRGEATLIAIVVT